MRLQLWQLTLTTSLLFFSILVANAAPKQLSVNAKFSGTLIENQKSCTIYPGDENITLHFPSINTKELQDSHETKRFPFSIRLENCDVDPSVPRNVKVYLTGNANGAGMLMFDPGSGAQGMVIGIEHSDGRLLPLNSTSANLILPLNTDIIAINLQAYMKVENMAAISIGDFSATLNYILEYE